MAEQVISKDMMDYTIDSLITMTVEELESDLDKKQSEILYDFLKSDTCRLLRDTSLKIWWNGPTYLAEMYLEELERKKQK